VTTTKTWTKIRTEVASSRELSRVSYQFAEKTMYNALIGEEEEELERDRQQNISESENLPDGQRRHTRTRNAGLHT
jgi:hypothetical protein